MTDKIMYSASFSYGEVSLIKITISKETAQTISVSDKEVIIDGGYQYFGYKRVYKNSLNLFDTLTEAAYYLIGQLMKSNEDYRESIKSNQQSIDELREALDNEH